MNKTKTVWALIAATIVFLFLSLFLADLTGVIDKPKPLWYPGRYVNKLKQKVRALIILRRMMLKKEEELQ